MWTFYSLKNPEKNVSQFPQKILSSTTFSTLIVTKMFLEHEIDILEWFVKDHVTLQTEVMAAENPDLPSQE